MTSLLRSLYLATMAGMVALPPLQGQQRDRGLVDVGPLRPEAVRGGFFATFALGGGRERYRFSDQPNAWSNDLTKPTVILRLGGTPSPSARIGAELFGWGNEAEEGYESFVTAMITGQFYPGRRSGFYLKGGIGYAHSGTDFNDGGSANETGFGHTLGVGWDLRLSPNLSLSPTVDFYQGGFDRRGEATLTERVVNIGVAITWQSGARR